MALASATNMLLRDETIDLYQTDIVDTKEKYQRMLLLEIYRLAIIL
ncbi:hypothetical protein [Leuconostoc fallax]|nr:hypothetical protein [Leuconostoc fallax]